MSLSKEERKVIRDSCRFKTWYTKYINRCLDDLDEKDKEIEALKRKLEKALEENPNRDVEVHMVDFSEEDDGQLRYRNSFDSSEPKT